MYTVQALCTCIPLATRISIMLPSTDSLSCGEHGITAPSALSLIIRPDGAWHTKVNTGWPCLRCSRTTGLEQPPGRYSSLLITGHFQTLTQDSSFTEVFLLSFRLTIVTLYSALEVNLLFTALYKLTILHYITLHYVTQPVGSLMYSCCSSLITDWSLNLSIRSTSHWSCDSSLMERYSWMKACGCCDA